MCNVYHIHFDPDRKEEIVQRLRERGFTSRDYQCPHEQEGALAILDKDGYPVMEAIDEEVLEDLLR